MGTSGGRVVEFPGHQLPDVKAIINGLVRELETETNARVEAEARAFESEAQLSATRITLSQTASELSQANNRITELEASAATEFKKGREKGRTERTLQLWIGAFLALVIGAAAAFVLLN